MSVDIKFSAYQLIIGDKFATKEDFEALLPCHGTTEKYTDTNHFIEVEKINDLFYWVYSEYGKTLPYASKVYNEHSQKQEMNPRKSHHAELNRQIFCLYDVGDMVLYLSNNRKKNFINLLFSDKLGKETSLKSIFNSIEDFFNAAKYITKIELVRRRNLMTFDADIFNAADDVFGLGTPTDAKLEVNYQPTRITEKFKAVLKAMRKKKQGGEIETFICIGKDDSNFESLFNLDSLQYKTDLKCSKDVNGMIDKREVKELILKKISSK